MPAVSSNSDHEILIIQDAGEKVRRLEALIEQWEPACSILEGFIDAVCFLAKFGPKNDLIQETGVRAVMKDSVYYVKVFSIKNIDVKFIIFGNLIIIFDFDYVGLNPGDGPGSASILASVFGYDLSALLSCLNAKAWRHD